MKEGEWGLRRRSWELLREVGEEDPRLLQVSVQGKRKESDEETRNDQERYQKPIPGELLKKGVTQKKFRKALKPEISGGGGGGQRKKDGSGWRRGKCRSLGMHAF